MDLAPGKESAVVDFMASLFRACGYAQRPLIVRTRRRIPLVICGQDKEAAIDVCIAHWHESKEMLLLVVEDKAHLGGFDPEPHVVAAAIAVFAYNNRLRAQRGLAASQAKTIPAIAVKGTMPIFYKVPVTTALVDAVASGTWPVEPTVALFHLPAVSRPARRWDEGMRPLDNRKLLFSIYEAFKGLITD